MDEQILEEKRARFLEPEERDGYMITAETKAAWRVLLDMLEVLMGICKKYNLRYFLIGGSMLGAARHKGFIPWDDDIDIGMPRMDYNKLKKVLANELPSHMIFQLMGHSNDDSYWPFIKIRNCRTAGIDYYHTNLHMKHNMGIFMDIFPIDGVPQGKTTWRLYNRLNKEFLCFRRWPTFGIDNRFLNRIRKFFYRLFGRRFIFDSYEKYLTLCSRLCRVSAAESVAYIGIKDNLRWDVSWFDDSIWLDFEYLKVPVPRAYDASLSRHYSPKWRTPVKGGALHNQLDFSTTKGWKQVLVEKYGYTYEELKHLK